MEIISTDRNALSNGRVVGIEVDLKGGDDWKWVLKERLGGTEDRMEWKDAK